MKGFIISLFVVLGTCMSYGQISKGTFGVGGDFTFANHYNHDNSLIENYFLLAPNMDFFFKQNMAASLKFSYDQSTITQDFAAAKAAVTKVVTKTKSWGIHPQYKYYKNQIFGLGEKAYVFGIFSFDFLSTKRTIDGTTDQAETFKSYGLTISPGFCYRFCDAIAAEFLIGDLFSGAFRKNDGGGKINRIKFFNLNTNSVSVGLKFFIL
jgi:hypothetical protein